MVNPKRLFFLQKRVVPLEDRKLLVYINADY
jgi:hypothetical protein